MASQQGSAANDDFLVRSKGPWATELTPDQDLRVTGLIQGK